MKYVTLQLMAESTDPMFVDVRPEQVSDIADHPVGGALVTMSHGKEHHVGGSREQVNEVLVADGDDVQKQMVEKIDGLMAQLIPVFANIETRLRALEAK